MGCRLLVLGSSVGVVVQRQRPPADVDRTGERVGVAVERGVGGGEDHQPVEDGKDPLHGALHADVPQLEVAAPLVLPVAVEVEQRVEAAVDVQPVVDVEVGVDLQEAAPFDLVESTAEVVGVGEEPVDPGQPFEEVHEDGRVALVQQVTGVGAEVPVVGDGQLDGVGAVGVVPVVVAVPLLGPGEFGHHLVQHRLGQDVVDHHMGERSCRHELVVVALAQLFPLRMVEEMDPLHGVHAICHQARTAGVMGPTAPPAPRSRRARRAAPGRRRRRGS